MAVHSDQPWALRPSIDLGGTGERSSPNAAPGDSLQEQRVLSSQALLGNAKEVCISHRGQTYRLRETAQGKLLMTK